MTRTAGRLRTAIAAFLLVSGALLAGGMIFRGAGATGEPARLTAPGDGIVWLNRVGCYAVMAELVISPREGDLIGGTPPAIEVEVTDRSGARLAWESPECLGRGVAFLLRRRGHMLGRITVPEAGYCVVKARWVGASQGTTERGVVLAFVPLATPGHLLWLLVGFGGQIFFSMRFLVQWIASEKAGRSLVPRTFWHFSLVGGAMVLAYALHIRDPVFIAAYVLNTLIYTRNLVLLHRKNDAANDRHAC